MNTTTEAHVSTVAELIRKIAQDVGYDPSLIEAAVAPDDKNIVYFDDDGGVAVRTRQHITKEGGTQGGTRLLLVKGGEVPNVEAALAHSYDLSGVMTLKTGNIEAAIAHAISGDKNLNSWFKVPKTGGAKGVLAMRADHHADKKTLENHLRTFVRGHLDQLRSGDGIGPDMGVSPEMMNIMGDEAAKHLGEQYRRQFTNRGKFPGRDEATGRYAIAAMQILSQNVPTSKRTHVIQGMGSAGGHYARILQNECAKDGHRVVAIGDRQRGLVALDRNRGLVWDKDYTVDASGTITWWNEDMAESIDPEKVLFVPAGIKTLAAIGGVINPENYQRIIGDRASAGRTRVIIEIANMGIVPAAAKKIEKTTDVLIGAAPFVSAGGVLASLWERHEPLLETRLGRKIKYEDVADALMLLAASNAEVVKELADKDHIGLHTAAHRLGFKQQFVA